jgi:hypothetical protein
MAAMHASVITAATIRIAGQVPTDISISHLGTREQEASLRIGELLIYVRDPHIVANVAQLFVQKRPATSALPHVIGLSRLHLPVRVGLVGVVIRLGGNPNCTASRIAGRPGHAEPSHVRVEIGPIAWEICDQVGWHSIGHAWTLLHRQLTAIER